MNPIPYQQDIHQQFLTALNRDRVQFAPEWLVSWQYQDKREQRNVRYDEDHVQTFQSYNGPGELLHWFNWQLDQVKPDYFKDEWIIDLVAKSRVFDKNISDAYNIPLNFEKYDLCIGRNNAQDYLLANLYPHPSDVPDQKILDFGAGYGRQANLWMQMKPDTVYIGMDAIPKSYCLQHLYYSFTGKLMYDYVSASQELQFRTPGIYHLPTWRTDLIPDQSIDRILAVQVLPEINKRLARHIIEVFHRILKPGGALYIRDHDTSWRPGHKLDLNKVLRNAGFTLEYRAHIVDKEDLLGIPRIWRKTNPRVEQLQQVTMKQQLNEFKIDFDAVTGGRIKRIFKYLFKSTKSSP